MTRPRLNLSKQSNWPRIIQMPAISSALIYDKKNDRQKALEQFERVAELNPDNEDVKKIVANLKAGKKALDGLEETGSAQGAQGGQNPPAVQREQEPVPPETPIENPQPQTPPADQNQNQPQQNPPQQNPTP